MSWYKKAEIVQRLFDLGSNPDSISIYLCGIFKEKKTLIFSAVIRQIGFESFLELILETIDILNESEPTYLHPKTQEIVKKTPGGVYMTIFKHSDKVAPDTKHKVLKELKYQDKVQKRKYKGLLGLMNHLSL